MTDAEFAPGSIVEPFAEPPVTLLPIEIKALVRHRDGYRCVECGISAAEHVLNRGRNLDVHRVIPGSKYTVDGCVTLCKECHNTKPKSPRGTRPDGSRTVTISGPLLVQLKKLAKKNRRTVTAQLCIALEEFLTQKGFWPPPPP